MVTHTYLARPVGLQGPAYCDTSFLLDLFAYAHPGALGSASAAARARIADAQAFYIWARLQGLEFFVSVLAIEEAYHKLLFGGVTAHLRTNVGVARDWKDLRRRDAATFNTLIANGRSVVQVFHSFMRGSGTRLITFGASRFIGMLMREARLCRYARAVLSLLDVDAMVPSTTQ